MPVATVGAMRPDSLSNLAGRSIEVNETSIEAKRQVRFSAYDGRPLRFATLLERGPGRYRAFNHAVLIELPLELQDPDAFDEWQCLLATVASTRSQLGGARGWALMVADSRRIEVQQRASTRPACPLCARGEEGLRAGESSSDVDGPVGVVQSF